MNRILILIASVAMSLGCSNQWRSADTGRDAKEVAEILAVIERDNQSLGVNDSARQNFFDLTNEPDSTIFFGEAPGLLGPVVSLLSLLDFSFLGQAYSFLSPLDIEAANVFFVDLPAADGNWAGLLVDIKLLGNTSFESPPKFFYSLQPGSVQDGEYQVVVEDDGGTALVLRSLDVDSDGFLEGVIQLQVYDFDSFGQERYLGKISTLVGYGP